MESPDLIRLEERERGVAILTLDRPEKRNALSIALMESLCTALEQLAEKTAPRVVILRGAGPVFCAGLDLVEAAKSELAEPSAQAVARVLKTVSESTLVTIAAVHGMAVAGGAGLMAACDFVVATRELRISFPEVRRGLVPALVSIVLRRRLQDADLRRLLLLTDEIDAPCAQQMRLIDHIVAADNLLEASQEIANKILMAAPEAIRLTKQLLRETHALPPADAMQLALEFHSRARGSDEAREGLTAFAERRAPRW